MTDVKTYKYKVGDVVMYIRNETLFTATIVQVSSQLINHVTYDYTVDGETTFDNHSLEYQHLIEESEIFDIDELFEL